MKHGSDMLLILLAIAFISCSGTNYDELIDKETTAYNSVVPSPTLYSPGNGSINGSTTPTFRWNASMDGAIYRLEISDISDFSNIIVFQDNIVNNEYTLIGNQALPENGVFYWTVIARDTLGRKSTRPLFVFTIDTNIPVIKISSDKTVVYPDEEFNLLIESNEKGTLIIFKSRFVDFSDATILKTGVLSESDLSTGLIKSFYGEDIYEGAINYIKVEITDVGNNTGFDTLSIQSINYAPEAPENLSVTDGGFYNKTRLQWDAVNSADKYVIYRSESEFGEFIEIGESILTSYEDINPDPGIKYYYKVKSWSNSGGYSGFSNFDSGYVNLSCPVNLNASSNNTYNHLTLSWNNVPGADGYRIYRSNSRGGSYNPAGDVTNNNFEETLPVTETDMTITALENAVIPVANTVFYYKVIAYNEFNESAYSETKSLYLSKNIKILFSNPLNPATINNSSLFIYSKFKGYLPGTFSYSSSDNSVIFKTGQIIYGDSIDIIKTNLIKKDDNSSINPNSFRFHIKSIESDLSFNRIYLPDLMLPPSVAGDIDGDNDIDIAHAVSISGGSKDLNYDGIIDPETQTHVYRNNGDGNFANPDLYYVGSEAGGSAFVDIDRDYDLDLITSLGWAGFGALEKGFMIYTNNSLGAIGNYSNSSLGLRSSSYVPYADINNDGFMDLSFSHFTSIETGWVSYVSAVRIIDKFHTYSASTYNLTDYSFGASPIFADIDKDGWPDLVLRASQSLADSYHSGIPTGSTILYNKADGTGTFNTFFVYTGYFILTDPADLNGDGYLDYITAQRVDDNNCIIKIFINNGLGNSRAFTQHPTTYPVEVSINGLNAVCLDINGDGKFDLIYRSSYSATDPTVNITSIRQGMGNGSFGSVILTIPGTHCLDYKNYSDVDGDGKIDIFVSEQTDPAQIFFKYSIYKTSEL